MALETTDLLVAYRPSNKTHYRLAAGDLAVQGVPDGTEAGQYLIWNGTAWIPSDRVDGGTYAS